jgi:hypothetical protein
MLVTLSHLAVKEIFPGFRARIVHTERKLIVNGTPHRLTTGVSFVIPPDVPHSGRALSNCRVLDVFAPVREDYK